MTQQNDKQKIAFLKGELRNFSERLKEELKINVDTQISEIKRFHAEALVGENSKENQIQSLIDILENYENEYEGIKTYYNELLVSDEENISIKKEIEKSLEEIKAYKNELLEGIDGKISIKESIENIFKKLDKYHKDVFGVEEEKDDAGNIIIEGTNGFKQKLNNLYTEKKKEYEELKIKIEGLMGKATGVGLSQEFAKMKESFQKPKILWNVIFIGALAFVLYFSKDLEPGITFEETSNMLFAHLPFIGAFVWLAYFASKKQSQSVRLEQEYAHKESFAKSFEGYRDQVEKLGDNEKSLEIKQLLMHNLVIMMGENPSETLDKNHGTNPPIWEYLFGIRENKKREEN